LLKVLNGYAGIGGNRKLWKDVDVTAIENVKEIADVYQSNFPKDKVIIADAHQYLLDHYSEYDFIWMSPPCQTHSSFRHNICVKFRGTEPKYPDMRLYQEIIFLQHHFKGKWVVENVCPYYKELIPAQRLQRHLFWANFTISPKEFKKENIRTSQIPDLQILHGFDLSDSRLKEKRQILRNCVLPELGEHIFQCATR
jgi:DNA (cytosine-5)-methyltransferase 1